MSVDSSLSRGEILIVEDNKSDLELISEILKKAGYRVPTASDGDLALRSMQKLKSEQTSSRAVDRSLACSLTCCDNAPPTPSASG